MIRCRRILSSSGQSLIRPDELVYNLQLAEVQVRQKMEDTALSRLYRGYQDAPDDVWVSELCGSSIRSFLTGKHSRSDCFRLMSLPRTRIRQWCTTQKILMRYGLLMIVCGKGTV
jgi:hypothetical protein